MTSLGDEATFLGCILQDPQVIFKTTLTEGHFFEGKHRRIFIAMRKCADDGVAIDYIAVRDRDDQIDRAYITQVHDAVFSAANWKFYQGRLIRAYQLRKLERLGRTIAELSKERDPGEVIELAEKELLEIGTNGQTRRVVRLHEVMPEAVNKIKERSESHGQLPGLSTGIEGLDFLIGGLQNSRYYIIGARPSEGKSALALNIATAIAMDYNTSVGIISAESSNYEIAMRAISSRGRIRGNALMLGLLSPRDMTNLTEAVEKIKAAPVWLYDAPNPEFNEVKSVARQMVALNKTACLIVDYVQILQWADRSIPFHEQVKNISLSLKQLARELKIPVVALAQLRRDAQNREPEISDLGDSSQLEKDADALMFIYHKKAKRDDDGREMEPEKSYLLVKKNRDGACGQVNVVFDREHVTFRQIERD